MQDMYTCIYRVLTSKWMAGLDSGARGVYSPDLRKQFNEMTGFY